MIIIVVLLFYFTDPSSPHTLPDKSDEDDRYGKLAGGVLGGLFLGFCVFNLLFILLLPLEVLVVNFYLKAKLSRSDCVKD